MLRLPSLTHFILSYFIRCNSIKIMLCRVFRSFLSSLSIHRTVREVLDLLCQLQLKLTKWQVILYLQVSHDENTEYQASKAMRNRTLLVFSQQVCLQGLGIACNAIRQRLRNKCKRWRSSLLVFSISFYSNTSPLHLS